MQMYPLTAQSKRSTLLGAMSDDKFADDTIANGSDVNLYSFTVLAGQRIAFDVDHASSFLDAELRLFDSSGNQLAANDSGSAPNEGTPGVDPFIQFTFTTGGTYYIGV